MGFKFALVAFPLVGIRNPQSQKHIVTLM